MSAADGLVERLRRANRRRKALTLAACAAVVLSVLAWYASATARRLEAERALAEANRSLSIATQEAPATNQFKALTDECVAPLFTGTNAVSGLVVGVVHGGQKEVWGYGKVGEDGGIPDGETLFGILSVTKPLTAMLLAQLAVEEKLSYDDVAVQLKGTPVTFRQLVTHTSGLPVLASDLRDNSVEGLQRFLSDYALDREPGSQFEYSTIGFGALGMCLAEKSESGSFEKCLTERILVPLGMSSSVFELPDAAQSRFAGESLPEPRKDGPSLFNASGGLISSANDLLRFVSANLNPQTCPELAEAIVLTQEACPEIRAFPGSIGGLGWFVFESGNFYFHSGMSADFRAFVAFDLKSDSGVVILTNTGLPPSDPRVEVLGFSLLGALADMKRNAPNGK